MTVICADVQAELKGVRLVYGSEWRRNETVERHSYRFNRRALEHPFCSRVEQQDLLLLVHAYDSVHGRVYDRVHPLLVLAQLIASLFLLRDVLGNSTEFCDHFRLISCDIKSRMYPPLASVWAYKFQVHGRERVRSHGSLQTAPGLRCIHIGQIFE